MFNLGPDVQSTVDMPLGELSSKERESGDRYESNGFWNSHFKILNVDPTRTKWIFKQLFEFYSYFLWEDRCLIW